MPAAARPISRCRRIGFISPKPSGARAWKIRAGAAVAVRGAAPSRPSPAAGEGREGVIEIGAHAGHNFAAERS